MDDPPAWSRKASGQSLSPASAAARFATSVVLRAFGAVVTASTTLGAARGGRPCKRARRRRLRTWLTARPSAGTWATSSRKSVRANTASFASVPAIALADRGSPVMSAISPNHSPAPSSATTSSPRALGTAMHTAPPITRKNSSPGSPARQRTSPRLAVRSRARAATSESSSGVSSAKCGSRRRAASSSGSPVPGTSFDPQRRPKSFIFFWSITRERPSARAARETFPPCWRRTSVM